MMEFETAVIIGQTVLLALAMTVGIMYCFFSEEEAKVKKD